MAMNIYEKLLQVQDELKAPKRQFNQHGKYNYRNCEDILEAVKPLLKKNKLTLLIQDHIENVQDRFYIKAECTLVDVETGEKIVTYALAREGTETKIMGASQLTGAASSYARKYALNGLFLIDDTKDEDFLNKGEKNTEVKEQVKKLTENQIKRLYAIAYDKGFTHDSVNKAISNYGKRTAYDLTREEYDELVGRLQRV